MSKLNNFFQPTWRKLTLILFLTLFTYVGLSQTVFKKEIPGTSKKSRAAAIYDVKAYGAVGDGITDDAPAFKAAIAAAGTGDTVLVQDAKYKIGSTVKLKSGITLSGTGATLYMPAKTATTSLLDVNSITGATISGLKLSSDFISPHSYVIGIGANSSGTTNLTISNFQTENLQYGMKIGSGGITSGLSVNNWTCRNDAQCLYMAQAQNGTLSNLDFSARTDATKLEHDIYLEKLNSDLVFDTVKLAGSVGYALQMYQANGSSYNGKRITFRHLRLDAPNQGVVVWGYDDVTFEDMIGNATGSILAAEAFFMINTSSNLTVNGFEVAGMPSAFRAYSSPSGPITNVNITNVKYHQQKLTSNESNITGLVTTGNIYDPNPFVMPSDTTTTLSTTTSTTIPTTTTSTTVPTTSSLSKRRED